MLAKRKRSSDAFSDAGTSLTDHTDISTPRGHVDEKSRLLAEKRRKHAAAKLKLEEQILQAQQQKQHVAAQLEQLEGCEGGSDALGVSDLRSQLQEYQEMEERALAEQTTLDNQFDAAVAQVLGIQVDNHSSPLAAALLRQQRLQEAQVQQLAVEQQLAGSDFAVSDKEKHQAKKARLERISQVWDWLQGNSAAVNCETATAAPSEQQHHQQQQHSDGQSPAGQQPHQQQQADGEDCGQEEHEREQLQQADATGNMAQAATEALEVAAGLRDVQAQQYQGQPAALPSPSAAIPSPSVAIPSPSAAIPPPSAVLNGHSEHSPPSEHAKQVAPDKKATVSAVAQ